MFLIEDFSFFLSYVTYLLYKYCEFHNVSIYFYRSDFTQESPFCAVLLDVATFHALSNTVLQNN